MPSVLESVRTFLLAKRETHNDPALIDRMLDNDLELQIQVVPGTPIKSKRGGIMYTDGGTKYWPIRIPKGADSEPYFNDYELTWSLDTYCEAIGTTGWDWCEGRSLFCAFDFDGMTHGAGLNDDQLAEVRQAAFDLPYCEIRKSSGGSGYHCYVMLDSIPSRNHTAHAALAKRVLKKMSSDAKFDFASRLDVCGGNFWFWSRKATKENGGFSLI
jgi:hypothetical protein